MKNLENVNKQNFNFLSEEKIELGETSILKLDVITTNFEYAIPFREYIFDLIRKGYKNFIIDLRNVYYIDSTFLGTLVVILKRLKMEGGILKIVIDEDSKSIPMFQVTDIQKVLDISHNLDEVKQELVS